MFLLCPCILLSSCVVLFIINGEIMDEQRKLLVAWLLEAAETVRCLEAEAKLVLDGDGGQLGFEQKMREKALFLAGIADEGEAVASHDPEIMERLRGFSSSASTSLSVGSVFFMSALLYPEDYKSGQDNDLEALAREVG